MADEPRTPPQSTLNAMQLLSAALRKPTAVSGRITGIHNVEGQWVPHAAIELTTTQLMGAGESATMTLVMDADGLHQFTNGLIDLYEQLVEEVVQAIRLQS